jgi:putative endonuclease
MGENVYCVYIITNKHNTVLYTGVTNNLKSRVPIQKEKGVKSVTRKYNTEKLIYFETCGNIQSAISREKQIKAGSRKMKIDLIESMNPNWIDLYDTI